MKWSAAKVLVTGADGFIGSHLVEELVRRGAQVKAFNYYNSFNRWGWLDVLPKDIMQNVEVFSGDIRDPHGVAEAMQGCAAVFHLAALIGIPFSYHSPDSYVDTNVKGTLNVLQAARRWDVKRVIHTSTSEVYGTAQYVPIDEQHPINPQSPYAATKSAADTLALSFHKSFGLPVTVVRPFNTFGPRQSARAVIPTIISQILSGMKIIKLGNLDATRDLNYVVNTVESFLAAAESGDTIGDVYNSGSGSEISIRDLVSLIQDVVGVKVDIQQDEERMRPIKSEVERLVCSAQKLTDACGWQPRISLKEGIQLTVHWMRDNLDEFKSDIYNI